MLKKVFNGFLLLLNIGMSALLLLACLLPYISVALVPSMSIFSLFVPFLVLGNLLFLIYWIIQFKKIVFLPIVSLGIAYFFIGSFFQFRAERPMPPSQDFSIMAFNTRLFNKYQWSDDPSIANQIVAFIKKTDPSVICFQEFDVSMKKRFMSYPYVYISASDNSKQAVQAIFSKFPIAAKGMLPFPNSTNTAIFVDLKIKGDMVRLYNIHLQSLRVKPEASSLEAGTRERLYKRLKVSFAKQQAQADIIATHKSDSPHKVIVAGDFNTNQFSSVYHTIKGALTDSFTSAGSGYGKTFDFKYFPMRIDFLLSDPSFEITYHKSFPLSLSDHFPVLVAYRLN
ncbi:MAG: endonuclease/exonuclease/phosphatase family protein [Bacteroidetes bacterium]|nr:endonuclease/exonuclease/phosphatase family protein [Bacteroidota bacterium]MDA1144078.1 endonuclease/exonuclease/phosphatase family protein [Bacteroidota bacterium]